MNATRYACPILSLFLLVTIFGLPPASAQNDGLATPPPGYQASLSRLISTLDRVSRQGPYHPSDSSLDKRAIPEWYKKAKFGIYFHWLVASVPAYEGVGCWYGNNMYIKGNAAYQHQIDTYGPLSKFGYKDFIPHLTGSQYNADQYAGLFKQAGAKFVAEVVDFHDGFPMYKTSLTPWNAVRMGPKRDVYGELARAVKKRGMKLGFAWHGFEHWGFFYPGTQIDSDVRPPYSGTPWSVYGPSEPFDKPLSQAFIQDCMGRLVEIVDQYHPDLAWFDFDDMYVPRPDMRKWLSFYYNRGAQWGKQVVDTDKIQPLYAKSCVLDLERGQTDHILPETWMEDTSVSWKDWSYIRNDQFKTDGEIIHELIDDTSKNGIMLLDIGPRPDGTIPAEPKAILQSIGGWLKVNGEAIYGTNPCYILGFGEGPHLHTGGGSFSDTAVEYNSHDFRFTQKGNTIFAISMDWPRKGDDFLIHSFAANRLVSTGGIASVSLLGSDTKPGWKVTPKGLWIKCPLKQPCEHAYAFQITLRGAILEHMNARRLNSRQVKIYSEWWNPQSSAINQPISYFHNGHVIGHSVLHISAYQKTHRTIILNASLKSQSNIEEFSAGAPGKSGTLASCQLITPPAAVSYAFDGKTALKGSGLGTLPQLTISLWVKPMNLSEDYTALLNTDSWDTGSMHFQLMRSGQIELALCNDAQSDSSFLVQNGEWVNLMATIDARAHLAKVYTNGNSVMELHLKEGNPVHLDAFCLGSWAANQRFLSGSIADVRIYNRVLTPEEIKGLVRGIEPANGLDAHWNFQSISNDKITDASGHGHDLVVYHIKN